MKKAQWSLGAKLAMLGAPFLLLVVISTTAMLWMSRQLDGGAAAVNEAGRMRMQAYRMALSASLGARDDLPREIDAFQHSMSVLLEGDPARPLFVPWDEDILLRFATVERRWQDFRALIEREPGSRHDFRAVGDDFVASIDTLVVGIERHLAQLTATLHLLQLSAMILALVVTALLIATGYVFVLKPVGKLTQAVRSIQGGNFDARVEHSSTDEFGTLASGFNGMAENLQSMYRHLEHKVAEKTSELEEKRERLEGLYEVTSLAANSTAADDLARGFTGIVGRIARADAVALRWSDRIKQGFVMLASQGLPQSLLDAEQCLPRGTCRCSTIADDVGLRVIRFDEEPNAAELRCVNAGFKTVINVPIRLHERTMGELDLFFCARVEPSATLCSLLEAFANHLASAMDNLRLNALEKEAAVYQERLHLARELHDSIAQSLAFLKIQVQLLRDAIHANDAELVRQAIDEIDAGLKESYGDVRELLMHFRTRTSAEDIESALAMTLQKFEHQSRVQTALSIQGPGIPLPPDRQMQVLHIVQEALSNVRKHANASQVTVNVEQHPVWRVEVRDDGVGFDARRGAVDESHVGLRIMNERAQRIGADLRIVSRPGEGTSVVLTFPSPGQA